MKILALNPPFLPKYSRESRSPAVTKSGTLYYPMWLCYAAGYLEKAGHEVRLIDAPASGMSLDKVIDSVRGFAPDMAVLDTSTPSIYNDVQTGEALKAAFPEIFITLVGVHVSALPEDTLALSTQINAVAFGEFDETLVELANILSSSRNNSGNGEDYIDGTMSSVNNAALDDVNDNILTNIRGLAFRDSSGKIRKNEARPYIDDLDAIPPVSHLYHKHLDITPYFYGHSRHPLVVIVTGRGCPFQCTYCVLPQTMQGHRYRKRSIESIVQEFLYIRDNFPGVKEIMIEDDTLTADRKRCRELAEALIATGGHRIPWSANSRADVDIDTLRLMRKAGCRLLCVGFESGEQAILDNILKAITLDKVTEFTRDAKRAGIMVHGCFMVGNRGETKETLEKTLKFAKELNPDTAQFYPIMVYPGTSDYEHFSRKGWIISHDFRKWLTEEGLHSSVVSNPDLRYEELVAFCDRARREFYLRPAYMFSKIKQMIVYPAEAKRIIKAGFTFFKYLLHPSIKKTKAQGC
ncbi:MAG: B12-binding domain-containing radical SAM protein [Chitinispirillia bacterium]|nr:B12-binding domain-containing radical SAM protein [Chitinispirillia bacterium]MCL2241452.1 B12-binding domain-containing radical SAM protein [Chitinispirillia bacterium]